jgi:hypothetical protein
MRERTTMILDRNAIAETYALIHPYVREPRFWTGPATALRRGA